MTKFIDNIQLPVLSESEKDNLGLTLTAEDDGLEVLYFKQIGTSPNIFKTIKTYWNGIEEKWDEAVEVDENGNTVVQGALSLSEGLILPNAVTVTLTGNTNNLLIPDLEKNVLVRIDGSTNDRLTGIVPPDTTKAYVIFLVNVSNENVRLRDNNFLSSTENRFIMGGNKTLGTDESAIFVYDPISLRWRLYSINN